MLKKFRTITALAVLGINLGVPAVTLGAKDDSAPDITGILHYISSSWNLLTRSLAACKTYIDPKTGESSSLYLPFGFTLPPILAPLEKQCGLRVTDLPKPITRIGTQNLSAPQGGLLYLPHPYVVPGGMFNEMYGWDSYFIIRGLIEDGRLDLAKGMVENFFFEIDHYGGVLNANRAYYLTRSQPPFLTSMIVSVEEAEKSRGQGDPAWLARAYDHAVKDYDFWTHGEHLAGNTGLSRYYDFGNGPVPELAGDAAGYYAQVRRFFQSHPSRADSYIVHDQGGGRDRMPSPANSREDAGQSRDTENVRLSSSYYKGDRAMRESGFDVSFRFGPFGAGTSDYAPVGLNSLLFKTESDLERISRELGKTTEAEKWRRRSQQRAVKFRHYFWNQQRGMFYDYDFKTAAQSDYNFATTFYPLWVGVATTGEALSVDRNLKRFEKAGGLVTSTNQSGAQWDYPYGWAPLQVIAVEGLRHFGYNQDADRLSRAFLSTVWENFRRDGTIREKYNVVTRSSETHIRAGYTANVIGFGWTNGVFLVLLNELPDKSISIHP